MSSNPPTNGEPRSADGADGELPSRPARYIMIGGFLGAGKSTAVLRLAEHLKQKRQQRVGLITNDQSVGLVDTALMQSAGFDVQEIAGGCFCCRFDSLVQAADRLGADHAPDAFVAEPVGSCTDLIATVSYPLRRIYGEKYSIAPLSVLVDPIRAARILGLREGKSFSKKVVYVYRKQLEEADLIVINKRDQIDGDLLAALEKELAEQFPRARVLAVSARTGEGLDEWFERIEHAEVDPRATMPIDYDLYGEGEALLGWLNATVRVDATEPIDGETLMMDLAQAIHGDLDAAGAEIAHMKMTLTADHQDGRTATLNLVRNDYVPELAQSLPERMRGGELLINVRAETEPDRLHAAVKGAIEQESHKNGAISVKLRHIERFRPAKPEPTWRMSDAETFGTAEGSAG